MLGVSLPNANPWIFGGTTEERPKQCLIKLYDDQIRGFKLNDVVTFIGVLEFHNPKKEKEGDEEMKMEGE